MTTRSTTASPRPRPRSSWRRSWSSTSPCTPCSPCARPAACWPPTRSYREAADHELEEYTGELSEIVGGAYGDAQGDRFKQVWEQTTADVGLLRGRRCREGRLGEAAGPRALLADANAYGTWLAEASKGRAKAGDGAADLKTYVQQVMDHADAYAGHDYDRAYRIERDAYEHMFAAGTSLAKAGETPKAAATLDAPAEKLRAAFAMLLGEHMQLIIDAQRATFAGAAEFNAAAAQVNANTAALTKGMGAIVGPKKAGSSSRHGRSTSRACWTTPPRWPATTRPSRRWSGRRCVATAPGWPCT